MKSQRISKIVLGCMFVAGVLLRLSWGKDIEYKGDERYAFETVQATLHGAPWPEFGTNSSIPLINPKISIWVFIALGKITRACSPIELARAVQCTNILAMALLILFIARCVPIEEQEYWWWGAALVFVNPFDVLLHRKIWAPSIFPIFSLAMLTAWWFRRKWTGAFFCGLIGTILGQIDMGGWFLTAAYGFGTLASDRIKRIRWFPMVAGALVGLWPLINWLHLLEKFFVSHWIHLLHSTPHMANVCHPLSGWFDNAPGQVWWLWITGSAGFGLDYSLVLRQISFS
jgi:hypothetical protein